MEAERIWILIARKFAGETSAADMEELEILLQGDPALNQMTKTILSLLNSDRDVKPGNSKQMQLFEKIQARNREYGKNNKPGVKM